MIIVNGWIEATRSQFKNNRIKQIDEIKDAHRSLNQGFIITISLLSSLLFTLSSLLLSSLVQEWVQRSLSQMVDELQILKKANITLKEERDLALEQSSSSSQLRSQEITKLKERVSKLSSENAEFEQRNTMLSSDLKNTKELYDDAKNEKVIIIIIITVVIIIILYMVL